MRASRSNRILGMTILQLAILGVMFLCLFAILIGGYALLNMRVNEINNSRNLSPLAPSLTPADTFTPDPTETPTLTLTPTSLPYDALIPAGWAEYGSSDTLGLKIYLPPSYVPVKDKDQVIPVTTFDANNDDARVVLYLRDSTESSLLVYTTMFIAYQPVRFATVDETVDNVFAGMMRNAILIERKELQIFGVPARKVVFDVKSSVEAGLVVYILQLDGMNWFIGFVTPYNELYTHMPDFDRAAQTFWYIEPTPTPSPTPTVPTATNTPLP